MENNYPKVAIMGGGSFATAIAKIVMENVPNIIWYMRRDDQIAEFKRVGHNPSYLSSVAFDLDRITFTSKINVAVAEADILFFATPSPFLKSHLKKLRRRIDSKIIVTAIKGIVPDENLVISDYFNKFYGVPAEHVVALSGPCHAEEIALERTSYLTIACPDREVGRLISSIVGGDYLRTSLSEDMYGVEYGAVLKNVYAIAAGICHGLKYGDNFQAVLVSNSIQEMNRLFGSMIGKGYSVKTAQMEMEMIAEGYYGTKCIHEINENCQVNMPILDAVYAILYERRSPAVVMKELIKQLM